MGGGSSYFSGYQSTLGRVLFTEMLDEHKQRQTARRLSIVGPCYTHEQWLAVHAERQRRAAAAVVGLSGGERPELT